MNHTSQFYIDGQWVEPAAAEYVDVINPATEESLGQVALGNEVDVDRAVAAARAAFPAFSSTTKAQRIALLRRIEEAYKARYEDMVAAISSEMGAPVSLSRQA